MKGGSGRRRKTWVTNVQDIGAGRFHDKRKTFIKLGKERAFDIGTHQVRFNILE